MDLKTYEALGLHRSMSDGPMREVNGRSNREIQNQLATPGDRQYHPNPEAFPAESTPRGTVRSYRDWDGARVFAGTRRDMWIYTPAGFDPSGPAPALMVFQDGGGYLDRNGPVRAAAVFDTMTAAGEMPPTVGVFVMPGRKEGMADQRQRSIEYDSLTDDYARFLVEDVLPFVEGEIGCKLTTDPARRTICGISSGGICAFTAAWYRPEAFGRVLSHCGSFTAIRGGHNYPYLIRSTDRKPIRVWLQSGAGDADIPLGSWPQANQAVAASLAFAGYDHKFVFGEGGHNLRHGGAVFADALRWLWRVEA
ncbi:MAG TPA: alpha/beta hydrolase-fold protein [Caulobacteraceae bacterium]|nr:alpha/beta hydrolase-fold protein [Caulobacteraceae bacterium]